MQQSTGRRLLGTAGILDLDVGWAVGPKLFGFWASEVVDRGDDESDCGRLAEAVEWLLGGADRWHTGETGFRVDVVISWYGGEACSRSDGRCDVKGRMGSKACGAVRKWDSGTLGSGPWPWTHAPVSAAWRRIIKGGSSCAKIPAYLAHGYRRWWRDLLCCEWAWLLLHMYLDTSGRRGIEYLWPAKKRSMTRTDWDKRGRYTEPSYLAAWVVRQQGGREEGAGRKPQEMYPGSYALCPASCVLRPAPLRHTTVTVYGTTP